MKTTSRDLERLRLAARARPEDYGAQVALADALYEHDEFDESRLAYEKAIDIKPDGPQAAGGLARILLMEGAHADAKDLLEAAMNNGLPRSAENLTCLGICYAFEDDPETSRTLLEAALSSDPGYEPVYGALARLCLDTADLESCEHYAGEGLRLWPENVPCLEARAQARFFMLDLDGAEADADAAVQLDPESIDGIMCKASVRMAREDTPGAMELLLRAQTLTPENPDVYNALGGAYQVQGDLDQAELCHRQAGQLEPENWRSYQGLAAVAAARGQWETGLEWIDTALGLEEEDPGLHFVRGFFLVQLERRDEARAEFETAVEGNPLDGRALVSLAELEGENPSEAAEAREHALRALELFPEGPVADRARSTLARLG